MNEDMMFDDYQSRANATAVYKQQHALEYLALGMCGEAGEVANKVKKILRGDYDNKGPELYKRKLEEIVEELGDTLWYLSEIARTLNASLSGVARGNLEKLADRARRGTTQGDGDKR